MNKYNETERQMDPIDEIQMDPINETYKILAMAIVKNACLDYLSDLRKARGHPGLESVQKDLRECEHFFRSEWFATLCDVDGVELMHALQRKEQREFEEKQRRQKKW